MEFNDEPFSVKKEYDEILADGKANKKYFVILSDSENLRVSKYDTIKHKTRIVSTFKIQELRKKLLDLEMQDGGIKIQSPKKPEKNPIWLYIISKG